jgi:hypothetical protein
MNRNLNPANVLVDPAVLNTAAMFGDATLLLEDRTATSTTTRILSVGGPSLSLDELGPIVINSNGTTSRIENWGSLSVAEQANSYRRISKRNSERLAVLRSTTATATATTTTVNPA